jgi:hypothetical protein
LAATGAHRGNDEGRLVAHLRYRAPQTNAVICISSIARKWGEATTAFIAPKANTKPAEQELIELVRRKKGPVYAPKDIKLVSELPLTPIGKIGGTAGHIWKTFTQKAVDCLLEGNVFVLVFGSISFREAQELDESVKAHDWYLGALQIDDTCPVH